MVERLPSAVAFWAFIGFSCKKTFLFIISTVKQKRMFTWELVAFRYRQGHAGGDNHQYWVGAGDRLFVTSGLSLSCGQRMCAAQHGLKEARLYVQHCMSTAHTCAMQGPWLCGLPAPPCTVVFSSASPGCLEVPLYCAYEFCCHFTAFKQYLADFDVFCNKVFRD